MIKIIDTNKKIAVSFVANANAKVIAEYGRNLIFFSSMTFIKKYIVKKENNKKVVSCIASLEKYSIEGDRSTNNAAMYFPYLLKFSSLNFRNKKSITNIAPIIAEGKRNENRFIPNAKNEPAAMYWYIGPW